MKRLSSLLLTLFCVASATVAQNVGINDDNSAPKSSAMLDVFSTSKGMLIPRVALTSTSAATPITTPETSLLVYNTATAGDVIPGYYYWNGSSWIRLQATGTGIQKLSTVTKSATGNLLKTDNLVFASGDITLTLPTVVAADDGLEITVKNVGTYTDLVVVKAENSKTIDGIASDSLTRWQGNTYVASGSNWIKKEGKLLKYNQLELSPIGSFTTFSEVIAFLNEHMRGPVVVQIAPGTYEIASTQTINLSYPVTFEGSSYGETTIIPTSGTTLFSCASECYFKKLIFDANGTVSDAIHFTGSATYHEVKDSYFYGFAKGIVSSNNNELWIFETDFEHCTGAAIEASAGTASGGILKVSECDFMQCAKGIHLLSGVAETVSIINCTYYNTASGTDIGILYVPATFTSFVSMFITNNAWNNQGTFISGFDFSRADARDANAFLINNAGEENLNPHCKINVNNNAGTTTITTNGTYYKTELTIKLYGHPIVHQVVHVNGPSVHPLLPAVTGSLINQIIKEMHGLSLQEIFQLTTATG
jgi:hypothetical protein